MTMLPSILAEAVRLAVAVGEMALGLSVFFMALAIADLVASQHPEYVTMRAGFARWWRERNRWRLPKWDRMPDGWEYRPGTHLNRWRKK